MANDGDMAAVVAIYLYSAHRAVIFAIAQLSCFKDMFDRMPKLVGVT